MKKKKVVRILELIYQTQKTGSYGIEVKLKGGYFRFLWKYVYKYNYNFNVEIYGNNSIRCFNNINQLPRALSDVLNVYNKKEIYETIYTELNKFLLEEL